MLVRLCIVLLTLSRGLSFGASAVMLEHPDRDVRKIFPSSTSYTVRSLSVGRHADAVALQEAMRKDPSPTFPKSIASVGAMHAFYAVYSGDKPIGVIHGVSVETHSGPLQLFTAFDKSGRIRDVYAQKIASTEAPYFRSKYYRAQFNRFGTSNPPDKAYVKPPARFPSKDLLKDHSAFVDAVRLSVLVMRHFHAAVF